MKDNTVITFCLTTVVAFGLIVRHAYLRDLARQELQAKREMKEITLDPNNFNHKTDPWGTPYHLIDSLTVVSKIRKIIDTAKTG